jgi:rRNA-processing protein FCF1
MVTIVFDATHENMVMYNISLDIAEKLCTCSDEDFKKLVKVFRKLYNLSAEADDEIRFIKSQRAKRSETS